MAELKRTIVKLFNNETGQDENSLSLLSHTEEACFKLRRVVEECIQAGEPLYSCGICGQPVVIRSHLFQDNGKHTFYFKHKYKSGDCPIKTASNYTKNELQAMKYNGAKESKIHFETKQYIATQLLNDKRFTDVEVEKVVKGKGWSKEWKKPDISAIYNNRRVVFEVQLSTTFLDVIVSRERFYQNEGVSIFWVFLNLEPEKSRATEKDVFFNNKANALSINDYSKELTQKAGKLIFNGHYRKPILQPKSNDIIDVWETLPVTFDAIKYDTNSYKPYFISFEDEYQKVLAEQHRRVIIAPIKELEEEVLKNDYHYPSLKECCDKLTKVGLYDGEVMSVSFVKLVLALISIRDGQVYFTNQDGKWTWLVNYIWEHHKQHWIVLLYVAKAYYRRELVFDKNNEKLNAKRHDFQMNWNVSDEYKQDISLYPFFSALFPEIESPLDEFAKKL